MDGRGGMGEAARVHETETEKALRAHLRSHNGSVLAASGMALLLSAIGWAVLYGASYWLTAEPRVSLQKLPAIFPNERTLRQVLDALLVTGLVDQRREHGVTWLHLGALAPEVFRGRAGALPAPEDPLAGVPQVKIRRRV